jgi:actin-related protein
MVAFGGDEVTGLVFDFGTRFSKIGYAGEESPRHVFPSSVGTFETAMDLDQKQNIIGTTEVLRPQTDLKFTNPFEDGLVKDWDVFEQLWQYSYDKALRCVSTDHPVIFSDPAWDTKQNREKLCELAFEKFGVPGFYLGRSAVLSA